MTHDVTDNNRESSKKTFDHDNTIPTSPANTNQPTTTIASKYRRVLANETGGKTKRGCVNIFMSEDFKEEEAERTTLDGGLASLLLRGSSSS